ncbi:MULTISPECIES: helix-turn-helix transcriptional regulator [unclassified Solwaraspora]|uniref:helix-turn-helix domain-containing protein n=1 Tax=unclassified Solwaraspora TaxID=2627926 RepID=UPI00248BE0AE|nr:MULTISPECIES: helix-turn-helix transcriptional regulator [unclassified Solwaraspora]WBB97586.1 helix-turn-helix transcriptional regulator [Solwaraspora sp. WMMA2059]WBC18521.1 helix-turn-helix transcriptional regulator [Solwaraspora sp. WMMA2080]WJK34066.1 helix-turn-helix transcriptional regulator [Solwaraspora sp. WMMA2065]
MIDLQEAIRKERTARGLSQEQLGALVGVSGSSIGSYEAGRLIPVPAIAKALDGVFETGDRIQRLAAHARGQSIAPFLRSWAENEAQASILRYFELSVVPGLLQTEAYARQLLTDVGPVDDVETALANRLARQEIITRADNPAHFVAVLDRSVLHRQVGSPDVMVEQLTALAAACDRPNVRVHVVPATAGAYAGLNGPFVLGTVHDRRVGYLDTHFGGEPIDDPQRVRRLEQVWEDVRSHALPIAESREMIEKAALTWS